MTPKNVKLIGHGFLSLVDTLFWYLPFASSKQAHGIREKAVPAVTEENWAEMLQQSQQSTIRKGHAGSWLLDGKSGWLSRTRLQLWGLLLRPQRLEKAGLVQKLGRLGSLFRGGVSRGGPSAAMEAAAAAAGRGGRR